MSDTYLSLSSELLLEPHLQVLTIERLHRHGCVLGVHATRCELFLFKWDLICICGRRKEVSFGDAKLGIAPEDMYWSAIVSGTRMKE